MHQACLIKVDHAWTLFIAGGKTKESWLNTTELLDLSPYLRKGLTTKDRTGRVVPLTSQWRNGPPMKSKRANFAMVSFKDCVYVVGGIEGKDASEKHRPVLSHHTCERYTTLSNKWESVTIANLPPLAAFSFTVKSDHEIVILGGTNGQLMTDELITVDFTTRVAQHQNAGYPFYTSSGHLIFRDSDKTLYSFGGINSAGINYSLKTDDEEWQQSEKRHSFVANQPSMELDGSASLYFGSL